jgi:uncharacterized membrane protein
MIGGGIIGGIFGNALGMIIGASIGGMLGSIVSYGISKAFTDKVVTGKSSLEFIRVLKEIDSRYSKSGILGVKKQNIGLYNTLSKEISTIQK